MSIKDRSHDSYVYINLYKYKYVLRVRFSAFLKHSSFICSKAKAND